jgi:serine protease Do
MIRQKFFSVYMMIAIVISFVLVGSCTLSSEESKPQQSKQSSNGNNGSEIALKLSEAFESAADKIDQCVVPIFAEQEVQTENPFASPTDPFRDFFGDDFFKRFFGTPQQGEKQTIRSMGSGVIVSKDGYILTNNHVVQGADKLTVVMADKKKYSAKIIGTDPQTDVAVIKIDAKELIPASLGNSDEVKVGQWVVAVGNPFQLLHTVTAGIISAKGRSEMGLADYEDFIQTDAAINPGNSGGALADLDGNVIGINTAINSPSGGNVGIGFAIPINMAKSVMVKLISGGKILRGYLGLLPQDIDDDLAKALKLKTTKGCLVGDVTADGPADKGGIQRGDVILKIDGQSIENSTQLRTIVAQKKPGTTVTISLIRDRAEKDVKVKLGEHPVEREGQPVQSPEPKEQTYQKLGLSVQDLTPDIANQLGYKNEQGVLITGVSGGSSAEEAGLQQGDLIKEVDRIKVTSVKSFNSTISKLKTGDSAAFLIRRGQNTFYVAIEIP